MKTLTACHAAFSLLLASAGTLHAGFAGTDVFVPAVARAAGQNNSAFYSTIYVTNPGTSTVTIALKYYENGRSNTLPPIYSDALVAGETMRYDNVVQTLFNLTSSSGAIRVTSNADVLVSSRTYTLPASGKLDESNGLFFRAVPAGFAIGLGETTQLQGVSQNASENFRYNFGYVETVGQAAKLRFTAKDSKGVALGSKDIDALPFERRQLAVTDINPAISTSNARIETTVLSGSGKVLVYGTQIANVSNDSAGFEMSFKPSLLAGSAAGVSSLNNLTGDVKLAAGSNVTITPSGSTLTIAASGGSGGGLTLPYSGTTNSALGFDLTNPGGIGLRATASGSGLKGYTTGDGVGVFGQSPGGVTGSAGVYGLATATTGSYPAGVYGESRSTKGIGVWGRNTATTGVNYGVAGETNSPNGKGVQGAATSGGDGVYGTSSSTTTPGIGVHGISSGNGPNVPFVINFETPIGVFGEATGSIGDVIGVLGRTNGNGRNAAGVFGSSENKAGSAGVFVNSMLGSITFLQTGFDFSGQTALDYFGFSVLTNGEVYARNLAIYGSKAFVSPHPEDASKEIEYISVEAPTSDVYFRGTAQLRDGIARISVPDHFRLVARDGSYMTTLTSVREIVPLAVLSEDASGIVVRGEKDVTFHYIVYAERDVARDHEPIRDNVHFRPETLDKAQMLKGLTERMRAQLVQNGTLNPDGTYNKTKADALGWKLPEPVDHQ
ncbi:MAG: hypothetical protein ABIT01_21070 [Thermoanaerobaculia bacterium]